jgi:uncharacterized protein YkwD
VQWTRTEPRARLAGAAVGLAWIALTAAAAPAEAAPRLLSLRLDRPAVGGRPLAVGVRAADSAAPLSGAVVSFGRGEGAFGLSACRAPSSSGRKPRGPFAPGSAVRLSVPHTFAGTSSRRGALRLHTGGCSALGGSLVQRFTVTPVRRGKRPKPVARQRPTTFPGGSRTQSALPGLPDLPDVPSGQLLPELPLPALPIAAAVGSKPSPALLARHRRRCAGASAAVGRAARARRKARGLVLCILNVERRARGLRPLRANRRLARAAAAHSRAMVRRRFFSHVAPGGLSLVDRLRRAHYFGHAHRWLVGENLGFGRGRYSAPRRQMRAWMRSSPHRANILEPRWREVGIGLAAGMPNGSRRGATYTSDFGVRR